MSQERTKEIAESIWDILKRWMTSKGKDFHINNSKMTWPLLTYGDLEKILDLENSSKKKILAKNMGRPLGCIHSYCEKHKGDGWPILNSIVVNKDGIPGKGYPNWYQDGVAQTEWKDEIERVKNFDWGQCPDPKSEDLEIYIVK